MAFQFHHQRGEWWRTGFICLQNSYHGDTIGSVSVGGIELFHSLYRPLLFDDASRPSRATPPSSSALLDRARRRGSPR